MLSYQDIWTDLHWVFCTYEVKVFAMRLTTRNARLPRQREVWSWSSLMAFYFARTLVSLQTSDSVFRRFLRQVAQKTNCFT